MSIKVANFTTGLREITARLDVEAQRRELAAFARGELEKAISSGAASPSYRRFVNGREGVTEDEVRMPGPILYVFAPLREAVEFALAFLKQRWPVRGPAGGGHFADSWAVLVDGIRWDGRSEIRPGAEAVIVNTQPYARKVETGAKGFSVPKGMLEDARQAVLKKWRLPLDAQFRYIELAGGYVLKGASRRGRRRDTKAGAAMKYPALVIAGRAW
jgi:hypothetical protein